MISDRNDDDPFTLDAIEQAEKEDREHRIKEAALRERMREWYADSGEIARLLRWLDKHDEHGPLEVAHCIEICEKPWHWDAEYSDMVREQLTEDERKDDDAIARGEDAADREDQR